MKAVYLTVPAIILCGPVAGGADLLVGCGACEVAASDSMVIGGGIGPGKARGQEGKLRAQAIVLKRDQKAAVVVLDCLMIRRDYLDPAVKEIEKHCGIPARNIMINATHTHHAPSTCTVHDYRRDEVFCKRLQEATVKAVQAAERSLAPCEEVRFWVGQEATVGQNSRLLLSDGTIFWVGRRDDAVRPTGPFDPELPVLAFVSAGKVRALLWNHSTHNIGTIRPGVRSPGIYGMASQELEKETGALTLFVSGAFGSTHNLSVPPKEAVWRLTSALKEALAKARPIRVATVRGLKRRFHFRVRRFEAEKEEKAVSYYCRTRCEKRFAEYTISVFRRMRRELSPQQGKERESCVQALRIGPVAFVAAPGELFTALGCDIKGLSPFRYTYIAGVANDWIGYIPDRAAFRVGGYQVWTGLHSYVAPGTGELFLSKAVELLNALRKN